MFAWSALAFLAGMLISVQSRMNGELTTRWGSAPAAAVWSLASGLVALTLLLVASPAVRVGVGRLRGALREGRIPRWHVLGGVAGGCFVAVQSWAVPTTGVALFTIAAVAGTTACAVVVDQVGLSPTGRVPATRARVVAALLVLLGVVVAVGGRVTAQDAAVVLPVALTVVVAALTAVQQATNGRVTVVTGQPLATAWVNFVLGTAVVVAIALPAWLAGSTSAPESYAAPWWAWGGGACGVVVIAVFAAAVGRLGVLLVTLLTLAGQLAAAVALDWVDPATRSRITPVVLLGLVVTVAAAALAAVAATRVRARAAEPAG